MASLNKAREPSQWSEYIFQYYPPLALLACSLTLYFSYEAIYGGTVPAFSAPVARSRVLELRWSRTASMMFSVISKEFAVDGGASFVFFGVSGDPTSYLG